MNLRFPLCLFVCLFVAKCMVLVIQHHCSQAFGTLPWRRSTSRENVLFFKKQISLKKKSPSKKTNFPFFPPAELFQAGEQRGMAVREEDRCLLCLAAAAVLCTHMAYQGGIKPCRLS